MPITVTTILGYASISLVVLSIAVAVFLIARNPVAAAPELGTRGLRRRKALEDVPMVRLIDPVIRLFGGWIAHVPIEGLRRRIDRALLTAGDWLGLTSDEFFGLTLLSVLGMTALGGLVVWGMDETVSYVFVFSIVGLILPWIRVSGEAQRRATEVDRGLPTAIDLAALCMGAGLDFPGAIRQIVDKSAQRDDALSEELGRVLAELELGRTRRQALESLGERIPTDAVRDFVNAVVQSEEKGNPLAEVLRIQATMLRMRRSVAAEEAAARAAVLMMGPLMLIFACIILVLLGPFIVNLSKGGL